MSRKQIETTEERKHEDERSKTSGVGYGTKSTQF